MLQYSFKLPHLEDSLTLYETAEPKQLCFHECLKQDSVVILILFQYPLKI